MNSVSCVCTKDRERCSSFSRGGTFRVTSSAGFVSLLSGGGDLDVDVLTAGTWMSMT